jgi:preprotein translocase subunit SecD
MDYFRRTIRENLTALEMPHIEEAGILREKRKTLLRLQQELEVSLQHAEVSKKDKEKMTSSITYYENRINELESAIPMKRKQIEEHYQLKIQALENERDMKIRKLEGTEIPYLKQQLQSTQERMKVGPTLTSRKDIERKMKFEQFKSEYDVEEERHKKKSELFRLCRELEDAVGKKVANGTEFKSKIDKILSKFGGDKTNPKFIEEGEKYAKSIHFEMVEIDRTIQTLREQIRPLQDLFGMCIMP